MKLKEREMKTVKLTGAYHEKLIDTFLFSPKQETNVVVVVCKGLFGVFDPVQICGVNILGDMLLESNFSHVVFFNSSRDFPFSYESNFEDRNDAFLEKTFEEELADLKTVIKYLVDHSEDEFGIKPHELILCVHGTSIGGTVSLMATKDFPQIKKLSLLAPPAGKGSSKKPIISTMPDASEIFSVAEEFSGDLFLLYGGDDRVVPKESLFLIAGSATKARVATLFIPDADHGFSKMRGVPSRKASEIFALSVFDFLVSVI